MNRLKLYSHPFSRGRIVRWMLEEVEQPYELEVMQFDGNIKSAEYLAINPMGKVPTLVDGDTIVTETAAICTYLADRFPEKGLAPAPDSTERGAYYRWLFFVAGPMEMAMSAKAFQWNIDDKNAASVGCGRIEHVVDTLEQALSAGTYLCGDRFSTADLLMSSYIGWEIMQKHLEPRPAFTRYVEQMQSRPAAQRANELDDALAKELS